LSDGGRLLVFAAPAGTGKSTIIARLRQRHPEWGFSCSATTRPPRPGEQDGREYDFLSRDEFLRRVAAGQFFEHEDVHGELYGTLKAPTLERLALGETLIFDLDVNGALNVKVRYPAALTIFLLPPSPEVVRERLVKRGTEPPELIERRLQRVEMEMRHADQFDCRVVNDEIERAVDEIESIVRQRFG
jgi:guanylate kinase